MRCEISHLLADHLAIPLKYQAVKLLSVQMRLRLNHSPGQNNDITLSLFLLCQTSTLTKDHLLIDKEYPPKVAYPHHGVSGGHDPSHKRPYTHTVSKNSRGLPAIPRTSPLDVSIML